MPGQRYESVSQQDETPLPLYSSTPSSPSTTYKTPTHSSEGAFNLSNPADNSFSIHNGAPRLAAGIDGPDDGTGGGGDLESGLGMKVEDIIRRLDVIESAVLPTREEIDEARTAERRRREERRVCKWVMIHLWVVMGFVMLIVLLKVVRSMWVK